MTYRTLILDNLASGLIFYYPMDETAGAVIDDVSPQNNNGTYTGVTLADTPSPQDGTRAPLFDGVNDFANIYSAALNSDWNGLEFTVSGWARVFNAAVWTDGLQHNIFRIRSDGSNFVEVFKRTTNNNLRFSFSGGGVNNTITVTTSRVDWFHWAVTVSDSLNVARFYIDGVEANNVAPGTWTGALSNTNCVIGAGTTNPTQAWNGWVAHVASWNFAQPADVIRRLFLSDPFPMDRLFQRTMKTPLLRR